MFFFFNFINCKWKEIIESVSISTEMEAEAGTDQGARITNETSKKVGGEGASATQVPIHVTGRRWNL